MPLVKLPPAQLEPCKTEPIPSTAGLDMVHTLAKSTLPAPPPAIQSASIIGIVACISSNTPTTAPAVALIVPSAVDEFVKYNVNAWVATTCLSIMVILFNIHADPSS